MVDYAGKLASIAGDREDFERISNVYVDLQNLAEELHLDIIWTAHHISRHTSEAIQGICRSGTCERDITIPRITGLAVAGCHECPVGSV